MRPQRSWTGTHRNVSSAFWDDGPYSIGTTSGGEIEAGGEDNNVEAGGKAMVDLVQWALANWP